MGRIFKILIVLVMLGLVGFYFYTKGGDKLKRGVFKIAYQTTHQAKTKEKNEKQKEKIFLRLDPGGHIALIRDLFFFDHGRKLISASGDKTIRIWDVSDPTHPRLIKTIRGEIGRGVIGQIFAIAVDPEEKIVASGGYLADSSNPLLLGIIRLYDLHTGRMIDVLKGHYDTVTDLTFNPSGEYLVSGSLDGTAIIWKKKNGKYVFYKKLDDFKMIPVTSISFSNDRVVIGTRDGKVYLYDNNFKLVRVLEDCEKSIYKVLFSPTGEYFLTSSEDGIFLYNKNGNFVREFTKKIPDFPLVTLSFSPDGKYLLAAARSPAKSTAECIVYKFPSGKEVTIFTKHTDIVFAGSVAMRNGKYLFATAGGDASEIFVWNNKGEVLSKIQGIGSAIHSVAISNDAKKIAFGFPHLELGTVGLLSPLEYEFDIEKFKLKKLELEIGFTKAQKQKGNIKLVPNPLLPITEFCLDKDPEAILLPFKYLNLLLKFPNRIIGIYKIDSPWSTSGISSEHLMSLIITLYPYHTYGVINNNFFALGDSVGRIFIYNLRGEKVAELVGHEGEVFALAASDDGKWIVSASGDQTVKLWYIGNIKNVNWGESEVNWGKLSKVSNDPWVRKRLNILIKNLNLKSRLSTFKDTISILYRAFTNLLKSYYMPIRKIYPVLTIFPSRDGREWVAWTPEGYFTASSPSALRLIGYHINQGFYHQAKWVSFSQLYDQYFRPDLVRLKLARPTEDLSRYTKLPKVKEALETSPPPEVEIISPRDGKVIRSEFVTVKVRVKDTGGRIGDIRVYVNGKITTSEGVYRVAREYPKVMLAKAEDFIQAQGAQDL